VQFMLRSTAIDGKASHAVPSVRPGKSFTVNHEYNDLAVSLRFESKGLGKIYEIGYIDLWRGEGWILEIQPDLTLKEGYDHPGHQLRSRDR
jgi:hypothetical protein